MLKIYTNLQFALFHSIILGKVLLVKIQTTLKNTIIFIQGKVSSFLLSTNYLMRILILIRLMKLNFYVL